MFIRERGSLIIKVPRIEPPKQTPTGGVDEPIPTRSVEMHVAHWPRLGRKIALILHAYRKLLKAH